MGVADPAFRSLSTGDFVVLLSAFRPVRDIVLAKPNYSFEKRQRDLEKKRKQEEKRQRKLADKKSAGGDIAPAVNEEDSPPKAGPADTDI